jgi:hypothetical protein
MKLNAYHFFIILIALFVIYSITQYEHLNEDQIVRMKRVDFYNSTAGHPFNAEKELQMAKVMAKYNDVNCNIGINELAFNDKIICDNVYSPMMEDEKCQLLGKDFFQPSENRMQKTKCVIGN